MLSKNLRFVKTLVCLLLSVPLHADVTITQLANEGVIIDDGDTRVMIDGMVVESYSVYGGLPPEAVPLFQRAEGPFSGIDLVLASHRHHDHNQPRFACQLMQGSSTTRFYSSSQVIGLMREKCRDFITTSPRIQKIDPQYGSPRIIEENGAKVTVFLLSHGKRKYARIQNYGHLVELGGVKLLHIGDAAMDATDFGRAGLDEIKIDVAFIPFWYFQPGPGAAVISQYLDAALKIAVHIPPGEMAEVKAYMNENYPRVMILENTLQEVRFSAAAQSPR